MAKVILVIRANNSSALGDNLEALATMVRTLIDAGRGEQAAAILTTALADRPDDQILAAAARTLWTRRVPDFHDKMLADMPRNRAYRSAIDAAAAGRRVLDIGTGSGLLAMIAARAGAAHVYACEANALLAETAREIIAANGFAERITMIANHSTKIDPERDLGGKVDLIVTETFDNDLLGEHALPALDDALARLAVLGAKVIPARASLRVALARYDWSATKPVDIVEGFALGLFNRHARDWSLIDPDSKRVTLASEPAELFSFDLTDRASYAGATTSVEFEAYEGRVDGVVAWIRLDLDGNVALENRPGGDWSHWGLRCTHFGTPIEARRAQPFRISAWHDQRDLAIWCAD